jgi:hypothetical protein
MNQEGNEQISEDRQIEHLRRILEQEQHRAVTYQEALEIGESLLTFFKTLAEESESATL